MQAEGSEKVLDGRHLTVERCSSEARVSRAPPLNDMMQEEQSAGSFRSNRQDRPARRAVSAGLEPPCDTVFVAGIAPHLNDSKTREGLLPFLYDLNMIDCALPSSGFEDLNALQQQVESHGEVWEGEGVNYYIGRNDSPRRNKGFAFVKFASLKDAQIFHDRLLNACREGFRMPQSNRQATVKFAKTSLSPEQSSNPLPKRTHKLRPRGVPTPEYAKQLSLAEALRAQSSEQTEKETTKAE